MRVLSVSLAPLAACAAFTMPVLAQDAGGDVPLIFHPTATRVWMWVTPFGVV